jgi:hypothetical protein
MRAAQSNTAARQGSVLNEIARLRLWRAVEKAKSVAFLRCAELRLID